MADACLARDLLWPPFTNTLLIILSHGSYHFRPSATLPTFSSCYISHSSSVAPTNSPSPLTCTNGYCTVIARVLQYISSNSGYSSGFIRLDHKIVPAAAIQCLRYTPKYTASATDSFQSDTAQRTRQLLARLQDIDLVEHKSDDHGSVSLAHRDCAHLLIDRSEGMASVPTPSQ